MVARGSDTHVRQSTAVSVSRREKILRLFLTHPISVSLLKGKAEGTPTGPVIVLTDPGRTSALSNNSVLDVSHSGGLDRTHLLDLELANVLEKPLAVTE